MVGDGLNDAPALAAAYASISPIDAVHLTQTQADAVFLGDRLAARVAAIAIAQRARGLMRQKSASPPATMSSPCPWPCRAMRRRLFAALAMSGVLDPGHPQRLRLRGPGKAVTLLCGSQRLESAIRAQGGDPEAGRGAFGLITRPQWNDAMNVLIFLIPVALALGLLGLYGLFWTLRSGQYEDLEGAAYRILQDDDIEKK